MKGQSVLTRVRRVLKDESTTSPRWSDALLKDYLYLGQLELIRAAPFANASYRALALTGGEIRQDFSDQAIVRVLRLVRNVAGSAGGAGPGISRVTLEELERRNLLFQARPQGTSADIDHFALDPFDLKSVFVTPPPVKGAWVEVAVAALPKEVESLEDDLSVGEEWATILQLFVQGWALMEDSPHADYPRGEGFINQALILLGVVKPDDNSNEKRS